MTLRHLLAAFAVSACLFSGSSLVAQAVIADSFDDWSADGTQGENNWFNGWYNLTDDELNGDGAYEPDDFNEFENDESGIVETVPGAYYPFDPASPPNHWTGSAWELNTAVQPWTMIGPMDTHPNGTNFAEEHWTIRRWISDRDQVGAAVVWEIRKVNPNGTGVTGKLFINGDEVDTAAVDETVGVRRLVAHDLSVGDIIEVACTPVGPTGDPVDGSDGSATRLTIFDGEPDEDGDGVGDGSDNCPTIANAGQENSDADSFGDACDNCPDDDNEDQSDTDLDGTGDVCDIEIVDTVRDWSPTGMQTENGLQYGYYNLSQDELNGDGVYTADEFFEFLNDGSGVPMTVLEELNHWNGTAWDFEGNPPWTFIGAIDTHPNGTNNGDEHWTIRRWVSDLEGNFFIRWHMHHENVACGGNGVGGKLYHNDNLVDEALVDGPDNVGVTRSIPVTLAIGDTIDLALTPEGPDGGRGDGCDGSQNWFQVTSEPPDGDGDGTPDASDNCVDIPNADQADGDTDGVGDVCDNCPSDSNPGQEDRHSDGIGDACDDPDGDGVVDSIDLCPDAPDADQADGDGDGIGTACDNCPDTSNVDQSDLDRDGIGDLCEVPAVADSFADFSTDGMQGTANWFNGWYDRTLDLNAGDLEGIYQADDFQQFENDGSGVVAELHDPFAPGPNHWNGTTWQLSGGAGNTGIWTNLGQGGTHPSGVNGTNPNGDEHWTIRRWIADRTGELALIWHVRKVNPNGTGVTGILFVNDDEVDRVTILGGDTTGVKRTVVRGINIGDTIDLAVSPEGLLAGGCGAEPTPDPADGSDGSFSMLRISEVIPPEPPAPPTVIADSEQDWSFDGTQGENDWSYGYYDQRLDVETGDGVYELDDFTEFLNDGSGIVSADAAFGAWKDSPNHWDNTKWDLLANAAPVGHGPWTEITCVGGHPAANAQGDPEVHWAIRRWQSDVDGEIRLSGRMNNGSAGGDGTVCRILRNGTEIFSAVTDGTVVNYSVDTAVSSGDIFDFAIDSDGAGAYDPADATTINLVNDGADGTTYTITISLLGGDPPGTPFKRGDADGVGAINLTDGVFLLNFLFLGGGAPPCADAADANDDGQLNITTGVYVFNWLFLGGPLPPAPGPNNCGPDPSDDALDCASYDNC